MKRITVYRHPDCERCRRFARFHHFFDWLHRVEPSTDVPGTGPLRLGEIVVEDARTGAMTRGVEAVRTIARNIPAYWPILPLLWFPPIARKIDSDVRGCEGGSCGVPEASRQREAPGHA